MDELQARLIKKIGLEFGLGENPNSVMDWLYLPSDDLLKVLNNYYSSELGLLKELYYTVPPPFSRNICSRFSGNDEPVLTLITSVFNGKKYIEEFLRNTVEQVGFEFYELLLIDCASPGGEKLIIDKYMEKFKNIRYIYLEKDPGLYEAWNIGVRESRGRYLSNANLDDRKSAAYYSILLDRIMTTQNDFISSLFWTCRTLPELDLRDLPVIWYKNARSKIGFFDFVKHEESNLTDQCLAGPFPVWRKDLHDEYGYFNEKEYGPSSDYEFWLRITGGGACGEFYKVPLGYYLRDPNSYARREKNAHNFIDIILRKYFLNSA